MRRLVVRADDHDIDILVGFALRDGARTVTIPVRPASRWLGLPIAHPDDWELAYRLLGRTERADALAAWRGSPGASAWMDR